MLCVRVSTSTLVYLLYATGDLLHFIFLDIYVAWAAARGDVCVGEGGGAIDFLQILFV